MVDGGPYLWHNATFEEFVLTGRDLVVAVIAVFSSDKVGPVCVHMFDMNLIMSSHLSHIEGVMYKFNDHIHVFGVSKRVVYRLHYA